MWLPGTHGPTSRMISGQALPLRHQNNDNSQGQKEVGQATQLPGGVLPQGLLWWSAGISELNQAFSAVPPPLTTEEQ